MRNTFAVTFMAASVCYQSSPLRRRGCRSGGRSRIRSCRMRHQLSGDSEGELGIRIRYYSGCGRRWGLLVRVNGS